MTLAGNAGAQQMVWSGELGLGTGLEGASPDGGHMQWQRARLRLDAGVGFHVDETPQDAYEVRALVELERSGSVGGQARYVRWLSPKAGLFAGVVGIVAPETLFGGGVGAKILPFGGKLRLYVEPSFSALPLGSDRSGSGPVLWAIVCVGLHADL